MRLLTWTRVVTHSAAGVPELAILAEDLEVHAGRDGGDRAARLGRTVAHAEHPPGRVPEVQPTTYDIAKQLVKGTSKQGRSTVQTCTWVTASGKTADSVVQSCRREQKGSGTGAARARDGASVERTSSSGPCRPGQLPDPSWRTCRRRCRRASAGPRPRSTDAAPRAGCTASAACLRHPPTLHGAR